MGLGLWPADTVERTTLVPSDVFFSRLRSGLDRRPREKAPNDWRKWLLTMFPAHFNQELGQRHIDFWRWVLGIQLEDVPAPFVGIWPRGGGKSTSAEAAVAALGARGRRRYCLYVRETQDQADKSVENIAALFETPTVQRFYPEHGDRLLNKFGLSKGWKRSRIRTAGGFTVDALGLDTAARGVKVEDQRPDLIIFDDIDGRHDSPATTKKKIDIITDSILPAGSSNAAVIGIQNLIIADGVFSRLVDGRADFLADRVVSGPFPAVEALKTEWKVDQRTGRRKAVIVAGTATWDGQNLAICQDLIDRMGLSAFLRECQHLVKDKAEGIALRFDARRHFVDLTDDDVIEAVRASNVFGGIDFGAWRFAFSLYMVGRDRRVTRIDELFSQRESLTQRAIAIHEMCEFYGIVDRMIPIWGDAANPQDIMEMNEAFRRGWEHPDTGKHTVSKLRVVAVANENKLRAVAVERINNALDHNILFFRRSVGIEPPHEWQLAMNAGSQGSPVTGSRLMYEIDNWSYGIPREGEAQKQDPDDHTADGADMIASMRYALMSYWKAAKAPLEFGTYEDDRGEPFDYKARRFKEVPHAADQFVDVAIARRTPRVTAPRPRHMRKPS
jgi:hypothetical protein